MTIDYNAITAGTGIVAAVFTAYALIAESRRSRHALYRGWLLNSAQLVTVFVKDYTQDMAMHRRNLASELLSARASNTSLDLTHYFPLLGFLEHIGYLTHRGVLDKEMVWNKFFHQVEMYYVALTTPINHLDNARRTENQPMWYVELEWLYHDLAIIDRKKRGIKLEKGRPNDAQIRRFLDHEVNIEG